MAVFPLGNNPLGTEAQGWRQKQFGATIFLRQLTVPRGMINMLQKKWLLGFSTDFNLFGIISTHCLQKDTLVTE